MIIPAYNEEHRLLPALQEVSEHLSHFAGLSEIIVVDDGSSDGTAALIDRATAAQPARVQIRLIRHEHNRGKGAAVRSGCLDAHGRFVLFTDADLATPISEAGKLFDALRDGYDVAIGSRVHPDGSDARNSQPSYRRVLGGFYHFLANLTVVQGIPDTQCGFKAFTHAAAQALFQEQQLQSIVFDTEVLFLAQQRRLRIAQIPVAWSNMGGSRMHVTAGHALRVFLDLLSIRLRHLGRRSQARAL